MNPLSTFHIQKFNAVSLVTKLPEKLEGLKRVLGGNPNIRK